MNNFFYLEKFLDKLGDIHSIVDINNSIENITPAKLLTDSKLESFYKPIYLKSNFSLEIKHDEAIFQHSSGFYIYLSRNSEMNQFEIKLIYKSEKYEQIKVFLNNLKKTK